MVCDSALYSQENLKLIEHLKWISRVPMTIKRAQELVHWVGIEEIDEKERERRATINLDGYKWKEEIVTYGGIKREQRSKSEVGQKRCELTSQRFAIAKN
jgi:transposase